MITAVYGVLLTLTVVNAECVGYAKSCSSQITIPDCSYGAGVETCSIFMNSCELTCEDQPGCSCRRRDKGCRTVGFARFCDASIKCEGTVRSCSSYTNSKDCRAVDSCSWYDEGPEPTPRPTRRPVSPQTTRPTPRPAPLPSPSPTNLYYSIEGCKYDRGEYKCNDGCTYKDGGWNCPGRIFPYPYKISKRLFDCDSPSNDIRSVIDSGCGCVATVYAGGGGKSYICTNCQFVKMSSGSSAGSADYVAAFDCSDRGLKGDCVGLNSEQNCIANLGPSMSPSNAPQQPVGNIFQHQFEGQDDGQASNMTISPQNGKESDLPLLVVFDGDDAHANNMTISPPNVTREDSPILVAIDGDENYNADFPEEGIPVDIDDPNDTSPTGGVQFSSTDSTNTPVASSIPSGGRQCLGLPPIELSTVLLVLLCGMFAT